jgi:flavin-binding protein dodecin
MALMALFAMKSMTPPSSGVSEEAAATEAVEQAQQAVDQINERYQLPEED